MWNHEIENLDLEQICHYILSKDQDIDTEINSMGSTKEVLFLIQMNNWIGWNKIDKIPDLGILDDLDCLLSFNLVLYMMER